MTLDLQQLVSGLAVLAMGALTWFTRRFVERTERAIEVLVAGATETEKRLALGNQAFQQLHDTVRNHSERIRSLELGSHDLSERIARLEDTKP